MFSSPVFISGALMIFATAALPLPERSDSLDNRSIAGCRNVLPAPSPGLSIKIGKASLVSRDLTALKTAALPEMIHCAET